jgi:hypothetical protein
MTMRTDSATSAAPMGARKIQAAPSQPTPASDIEKAMRAQPVRQFTIPANGSKR